MLMLCGGEWLVVVSLTLGGFLHDVAGDRALLHAGKLLEVAGRLRVRHRLGLLGLLLLELLSKVVSHVSDLEQRLAVNPLSIVCSS